MVREREIEEAIRLILATAPGERPMRPGVRLPGARSRVRADQRHHRRCHRARRPVRPGAVGTRIDVLDVLVSFDRAEAGTLYIDIHYSIRGVNDPRNLVFPFYVIPEEPNAAATVATATIAAATPLEIAYPERNG